MNLPDKGLKLFSGVFKLGDVLSCGEGQEMVQAGGHDLPAHLGFCPFLGTLKML